MFKYYHPCRNYIIKCFNRLSIKVFIHLFFILFLTLLYNNGYPQRTKTSTRAGEQRKAEKGLKDNKYFFYFINSSITNLGTEEEKKLYKKAIQRDIISQLLYMKFMFKESFSEIRKAQKILIDLYKITLKRDLSITKKLLNGFAPRSIESKDKKTIHFLRLGYRDMKVSMIFSKMADNYKKNLYSMRLYKYVRAIKKAKHSKRYAFLSMIEVKSSEKEKRKNEHMQFAEIEKKISKLSPPNKMEYFRLIHLDNYYKPKDNQSFYDHVWEKPDIHEIEDYKRYIDEAESVNDLTAK